jgi:hypothetical protein
LMLLDMISFASFKSPNMKFIFPLMIVAIIIPFGLPRKIWPFVWRIQLPGHGNILS